MTSLHPIQPDGVPGLHVHDLRVDYGDLTAVDGVSFSMRPGGIFGLVGPNGAGKTSIIRVLATLLKPTHGRLTAFGFDLLEYPDRIHALLGYMPDLAPVIGDLKVGEFLDHFAAAHGFRGLDRRKRVESCLEQVGMSDQLGIYCRTLSRGMMQRVVLAKTLIHRPRMLLLDEPASGMDPLARIDLRDTLTRLGQEGCMILLSSHILADLSDLCTEVAIMHKGTIRYAGPVDGFCEEESPRNLRFVEIQTTSEGLALLEAWLAGPGQGLQWSLAGNQRYVLAFEGEDEAQTSLLARLVEAGIPVLGFRRKTTSLEDMFKSVTQT